MIIIGLGANLPSLYGTPEITLQKAVQAISDKWLKVVSASSIWRSAPVPVSDQPWYCNAVCAVDTDLSPHEIWDILCEVEEEFGRVRTVKNAPRVIDLDLLIYHDEVIDDDVLTLPHPRMHERAFVLHPLLEVCPLWRHPIIDKSVDEFLMELPEGQEIKCFDGIELLPTGSE